MKLFERLIRTPDAIHLTVLRLILGIIFFAHGAQKTLGLFGGYGFAGTMNFFTGTMHIPEPLAFLAIMAEFVGGIALILGVASRLAALSISVNMIVAIMMVHAQNGLFMNWTGAQKGEGFEYHLLAIATAIPIIIHGSGALSIDGVVAQYRIRGLRTDALSSVR